jgi:predicted MFS family arabinose efflux permease
MSIFNITLQAAFALGFAFLGPVLVTLTGSPTVLGVVTALYIAATVACIGLPSAPPVERSGRPSGREAVAQPIHELREGFATVRGDREISRPIIHQAAAASIAGVLGVLGPSLAVMIGLEPSQLAVVVIPLGIGVVVGIVILRQIGDRLPHRGAAEAGLLIVATLTIALAVVATLLPLLPVVVVLAMAAGAAYAIALVSAQTALVESIPADVRGRVFGVLASVVSTASLVPTLVAGPLADRTSGPAALVIVGSVIGVIALWSNRLFGPVDSTSSRSSSP